MGSSTRTIYECVSCGESFDTSPFIDDGQVGPIHSKGCYLAFYTCHECRMPVDPLRGGGVRAVEVVPADAWHLAPSRVSFHRECWDEGGLNRRWTPAGVGAASRWRRIENHDR